MSSTDPARDIATRAQKASAEIARADTLTKNAVLHKMAELVEQGIEDICRANSEDLHRARKNGIADALYERLVFDESKARSRIDSLKKIASLPDPVGQIIEQQRTANGLIVGRVRVPLGVILMIYEARPHVTVNAGAFAVKSGNAIICKGGSEAQGCNSLLGRMWAEALASAGLSPDIVQVPSLSHDSVDTLLTLQDDINLVIPRGGKNLIKTVAERSRIPVIKHFEGVCHVYIGHKADTTKALQILLDSKLLMPAVCNAAETLLLDASMTSWLPFLLNACDENGIETRCCERIGAQFPNRKPATEEDWRTEYLDRIYSIRIVDDIDAAMDHISRYGSGHTDVIVTEDYSQAMRFTREVDSSVVLVNASTMFCDGETLGMGAEIGISTDKFHARGPMGLNELTSYKHVIWGDGQIMGEPFIKKQ